MRVQDILERDHEAETKRIKSILKLAENGKFVPDSFELFQQNLKKHIYIEEQFVFPSLLEGDPDLRGPLAGLEMEHASLWMLMDRIESEILDSNFTKTPKYLDEILRILTVHNDLESRNIYPRIVDDSSLLIDEIVRPEGWVCKRYRNHKRTGH